MMAVGRLLRDFNVDLNEINFEEFLPSKFVDENIKAIKLGYEL